MPRDAAELAARRDELERHGLRAASIQGRLDLSRPDTAEQIAGQMPTMAALNCALMLLPVRSGAANQADDYARLRSAGDAARDHGVTLMIETHPDLATNGELTLATMRAVDHPAVRVNFDPANLYYYNRDADPLRDLEMIAEYIVGVHLKDTPGRFEDWNFPAVGAGVVDFPALFKMLDDADFDGPYTLEIDGVRDEPRTEELVCARVEQSIDYLRGIGRLA